MNTSTVLDKPAPPHPLTTPLYDEESFEVADEVVDYVGTRLRGIAPWDTWLKQSQLKQH